MIVIIDWILPILFFTVLAALMVIRPKRSVGTEKISVRVALADFFDPPNERQSEVSSPTEVRMVDLELSLPLCEVVVAAKTAAGLTWARFAELLGVSGSTAQAWARGRSPSQSNREKLTQVLRIIASMPSGESERKMFWDRPAGGERTLFVSISEMNCRQKNHRQPSGITRVTGTSSCRGQHGSRLPEKGKAMPGARTPLPEAAP